MPGHRHAAPGAQIKVNSARRDVRPSRPALRADLNQAVFTEGQVWAATFLVGAMTRTAARYVSAAASYCPVHTFKAISPKARVNALRAPPRCLRSASCCARRHRRDRRPPVLQWPAHPRW